MPGRSDGITPRFPAAATALLVMLALAGCQSSGDRGPAAGPVIEPAAFLGLSDGEVVATLGQPDSARNELDAQIWQYGGGDCVVDFFLYPEGARHVVAHAEARSRDSGAALSQCAMAAS